MERSITLTATDTAASAAWLGSLDPYGVYGMASGTIMLIIAAAQWLASYATDRRALRLFSVRYLLAALGWFFAHPAGAVDRVPFPSVLVAIVLLTLTIYALDEYIGQASRRRLQWTVLAAAIAAAGIWLYLQWVPDASLAVYVLMATAMTWCAWLAWNASLKEPRVGHRYIAAAFATYPLTLLVSEITPLRDTRLDFGYLAAIPITVVGVTILVVSLLRARQRIEAELQQRTRAEAAVRDLNAHLEQRVAARTSELQTMLDGLEAFTRNVSHDLRGPLAGLSGLARLSVNVIEAGDTQRASRLVTSVAVEAERLQSMVQELLTLSKVGNVNLKLRAQPVRSIVDAAVQQLGMTPEGALHLGQVDLEIDALPSGVADAELLSQVFVNLIGNAARFAAFRHQSPERGTVRVGAKVEGDATAIYVEDDGPGFEPSRSGDLFKPFRRLHNQELSQNGIGLSIVKRIVERHGGRVWAEARPGLGATFWFTLANEPASARPVR
ncbi:MAG: HAMP domain-containing sensor histidine kinase [Rhizobacter sp.]